MFSISNCIIYALRPKYFSLHFSCTVQALIYLVILLKIIFLFFLIPLLKFLTLFGLQQFFLMCLGVFFFFLLLRYYGVSWVCDTMSFVIIRAVSDIVYSNIAVAQFFLSSPSGSLLSRILHTSVASHRHLRHLKINCLTFVSCFNFSICYWYIFCSLISSSSY